GAGMVVTRGDEEIALNVDHLWCDVVAFDAAITAGRFGEALELYRGEMLGGFFISGAGEFERWLETERARLQQAASRGAQALVEQHEAVDDLQTAADWARRATQLAPHEERPLRQLVTLLDRVGDRAGAVAAYEAFAKQLGADFEAEPAAETKALLAAVRARETATPAELRGPAAGGPGAAAVTLPAPGRRRVVWPALIGAGLVSLLLAADAGGWRALLWPKPVAGRVRSLAVLPLENLSADTLRSW